jgi:hypothetical protein
VRQLLQLAQRARMADTTTADVGAASALVVALVRWDAARDDDAAADALRRLIAVA